ncbi:hypothetical protein OESDEN_02728 [Oesophagostomum dentatum]|uniref:Transporter, major facilitator family protein n=1 Tax=Oesophagostomum dentatum TaxID=61180 RepID=A0A0B1TN88_OESDE|nr:hypothetical protein OESDEN_02728 [Oesophagostomum dentatum]
MMAGSVIYLLLSFFAPSCVAMAMMAARFIHGCGSGTDWGCIAERFNWCNNLRQVSPWDSTERGSLPEKDVPNKPSTPWKSVYVATVCSFIQEAQFSILFSSMWPYLRKLNPNAEEVQFGYVVAMYSLGQCISAPSLGYWSNRIKQVAHKLPPPCATAVLICLGTRFVQIFMMTTIQTLGSAFSMLMFSFSKEQAVAANAMAHLVAGILGVVFYFALFTFNLSKWMLPRPVTLLSLGLCASLFITTYPWPFFPSKVDISGNGTDWGCFAERFDWCNDLPKVSPWIYYSFYALVFGIALSAWGISVATLYTEIIGPRRQALCMHNRHFPITHQSAFRALITECTSSPVHKLYSNYGPGAPWIMEVAQLSAVSVVWVVFRKKMVPLKIEKS